MGYSCQHAPEARNAGPKSTETPIELILEGEVTFDKGTVRERLTSLLSDPHVTRLAVNMERVTSIDLGTIGLFNMVHTYLVRRGLKLIVFGMQPKVAELFRTMRLDQYYTCYKNRKEMEDALQATADKLSSTLRGAQSPPTPEA